MKRFSRKAGSAQLAKFLFDGFHCSSIIKNRYLDVGDYFENVIRAVLHDDSRSTAAVLLHEIVERLLCVYAGITSQQVDADDAAVLADTLRHSEVCYIKQHRVAERIERIFIEALGMSWDEHDRQVEKAYARQAKLLGVK